MKWHIGEWNVGKWCKVGYYCALYKFSWLILGTVQQQILQSFERKILEILDRESGLRARGMLENIWHSDQGQRACIREIEALHDDSHIMSLGDDTEETSSLMPQRQTNHDATGAKTQILQPDTILEASKGLEKFIIGSSVDLLNTLQPTPFTSTPVATRLREWLSSRISKFLWVRGSPVSHYTSELSVSSGSLINAALESKSQHCFTSVSLWKAPIWQTDSAEEAGVVSLVYSLICQLILLLERDVNTSIDLSAERFSLLESPLGNWKEATSFLNDLLALWPGILLCAIDGIDDLDYGRGQSLFADILPLVRRREAESGKSGLVFKTLFMMTSYAKTLDGALGIDEVVINRESRHPSRGSQGPRQKLTFDDRI